MANNSTKYQAAMAEAQCHYLAALFFHGLSNKTRRELKKKVHNNALTSLVTVPCTYNKVLQLTDHDVRQLYTVPYNRTLGVPN